MKILKRIFKIIYLIIKTAAIAFISIFVAFVLIQRFTNNEFSVAGYRMFSIVSESMAPKYTVGDIIIIKDVDVSTLKKGDDITYYGKSGSYNGKTITHRVLAIEKNSAGKYLIQTKGVNNISLDPIIEGDQVIGKVTMKVKSLSFINKTIQTTEGFFLCIFIPLVIIIGSELITSGVERYKEKLDKKKEK